MPPVIDLAAAPLPAQSLTVPANANGWRPVTVQPGDTVWQLAITHRTTMDALAQRNGLPAGGRALRAGQTLLVPRSTAAPASAAPRPTTTYVVRAGDTLEAVATRHRTSVAALLGRNPGVDRHLIFPGQRLWVPSASRAARSAAKVAAAPARSHLVRAGETMTSIAAAHGITLARLTAANRAIDPQLIQPGQSLALPGTAKASAAGTPAATSSANTFAGRTYPDHTIRAAEANRAALARRSVPSRTQTAALIRQIATRHGVDPRLALAVAYQESGWNHRVVSVANAIGTMQVIPASGQWASALAGRRLDLLDAEDNVTAGVLILRALQSMAGSREEAVAGYYQGLRSVRTQGAYADTKGYVRTVLALYDRM